MLWTEGRASAIPKGRQEEGGKLGGCPPINESFLAAANLARIVDTRFLYRGGTYEGRPKRDGSWGSTNRPPQVEEGSLREKNSHPRRPSPPFSRIVRTKENTQVSFWEDEFLLRKGVGGTATRHQIPRGRLVQLEETLCLQVKSLQGTEVNTPCCHWKSRG